MFILPSFAPFYPPHHIPFQQNCQKIREGVEFAVETCEIFVYFSSKLQCHNGLMFDYHKIPSCYSFGGGKGVWFGLSSFRYGNIAVTNVMLPLDNRE